MRPATASIDPHAASGLGAAMHIASPPVLMVREELSRTNEDGTLMYPHLQKFMPPIPSRFVQTRESTQAAISDTYNGDGKVYAALRAAAYVSWEILSFVFTDADW